MGVWRLTCLGKFELRDPNGQPVRLPTRKIEALLALLAFNRETGVSRVHLAELLWPSSSRDKQSESLRQALFTLRKHLGHDSLVASRTCVSLSQNLRLTSDIDSLSVGQVVSQKQELLSGFDLRIFGIEEVATTPKPVESLIQLLEWYCQVDPEKMILLIRENLTLLLGMKWEVHRKLLDLVEDRAEPSAWRLHLEALLHMSGGNLELASHKLKGVVLEAERERDNGLAVQALAQLGLSALLRNQTAQAKQAAELCATIAKKSKSGALIPTSTQLLGITLVHSGEIDRGCEQLRIAESLYKDSTDSMVIRSLRALFLAGVGRCEEADSLLMLPQQHSAGSGHNFIETICALARCAILLHGEHPENCLPAATQTLTAAEEFGNMQVVILARELLAQSRFAAGEVDAAHKDVAKARKLRRSLSMAHTAWHQKLNSIHPVMSV